jgi:hypothetical protein
MTMCHSEDGVSLHVHSHLTTAHSLATRWAEALKKYINTGTEHTETPNGTM